MGARDLISTVWSILDQDLDNTASVVNALVDVLEDDEKKTALLGAWNGFKVEVRARHCSRPNGLPTDRTPATPPVS
jgi:hypothetical protein